MSEWREIHVSDLCRDIVDCINKTAPTVPHRTPWKMLRTTNIRRGRVDTDNVNYVEQETYERWTRRLQPRSGDVILTREAPLGEVGILRSDDTVFLGQRLVVYRVDPELCDSRFLCYAMLGPEVQMQLHSLGSGATVEHLRVPDCEKLTVRCPPLPVQQRIGTVLGSFDDLIENNRRRIEVLEQMAQAIYREWFTCFRFPGHESATFAHSPLGRIPEGWGVRKVDSLAESVARGIAPKYDDSGPWTVLNQKCIRNRRVNVELARRQGREVRPQKIVRSGDVLINSTGVGTLGRVALYVENHKMLTADSHVSIVRPMDDSLNPWFGMTMMERQSELETMGAGTTGQTELARRDINAMTLLLPPPDIRKDFANAVWPLLLAIPRLLKQSRYLTAVRDALLPKLTTGKIDVSHLDLDAIEVPAP